DKKGTGVVKNYSRPRFHLNRSSLCEILKDVGKIPRLLLDPTPRCSGIPARLPRIAIDRPERDAANPRLRSSPIAQRLRILQREDFRLHIVLPNHRAQTDANFSIRSEEHTSELQSLRHLVCRLLLEKKNIYV